MRSFGPVLFFPLHPIPPLPSLRRIEFLATETRHELLRIGRVREAVDVKPLLVVADAMAAQAQRQILAEVVDDLVAAVLAASVGWAKARSAVPMRSFTEADQQVAATVGERKCVEKRSAFDLEPTIARHSNFPKRFGGHGVTRLCPPYDSRRNFLRDMLLTRPYYSYTTILAHVKDMARRHTVSWERGRCPQADLQFAPGRLGYQSPGIMTGAGGASLDWDRRRRVTPVQTASQEAWPEAEPLG